jgi:hypothetical protein
LADIVADDVSELLVLLVSAVAVTGLDDGVALGLMRL